MPPRLPVAQTVALVVLILSTLTACSGAPPAGAPVTRSAPASIRVAESAPLARLHAWDQRRARAWAAGDAAALGALYAKGSRAGRRDVVLLRAYLERGYVVTGMRMQVLRARVELDRATLIRIDLVDRLLSSVAVGGQGASRIRLPGGSPHRRTVELVRRGGVWLVRDPGRPQA